MAKSHFFVTLILFLMLFSQVMSNTIDSNWYDATATFYGDMSGGDTMKGACGYGDLFQQGYGLETTAVSSALFNDGLICGACFEIKCVNDPQWCIKGAISIKVTATNYCPPGSWCSPPRKHFDLSMKMFTTIAYYKAGIIPVQYRRVACSKNGGVRFQLSGNPNWLRVMLLNVANAGDVIRVLVKGSNTDWIPMKRNWGQNWATGVNLVGQTLSFWVTTSDLKALQFVDVAPNGWQFGLTYEGKINF